MAGLYVHIPYCIKKCDYCDFCSYPLGSAQILPEKYIRLIAAEAELWSYRVKNMAFSTVFIGGGTPSLLSCKQLETLFDALHQAFAIEADAEITIEVNPGTLTQSKAQRIKSVGINRVSVGLQSSSDALLKSIGRIHTYDDFLTSIEYLKHAGLCNINADIMYGLPGQTVADVEKTIDALCSMNISHISAYSLILEENTPLYLKVKSGELSAVSEDEACDMHDAARNMLESAGFHRYEISNYARNGCCCKHNINYWNNGEYLGLGAAAHSALKNDGGRIVRSCNFEGLSQYCDALSRGELPIETSEVICETEEMFECIMLGLRMTRGVSAHDFYSRFSKKLEDVYGSVIKDQSSRGLLCFDGESLRATAKGLDLLNSLLLSFMS